jgi:hypothetical protein
MSPRLLLPAAALLLLLRAPAPAGGVRTARFAVPREALAAAPEETRTGAWLVSPPLGPGHAFSAVGAHWRGGTGAPVEVSVSPDGATWGRWIAVPAGETIAPLREDGTPNPLGGEALGALVFVDPASRFVRFRVGVEGGEEADVPAEVSLEAIDPGAPTRDEPSARAAGAFRRVRLPEPELPGPGAGPSKPQVHARASWGARPPKQAWSYTVAGHVAIHHTASVADFEAASWAECAARVRAIQTYHMDTNGWNDIGYAYVVCRHGDVFQAREDDEDATDVQGAHDGFNRGSTSISALGYFHPPYDQRPTDDQLSAIVSLAAWISARRGIDPLGRSLYEAFGGPADNLYGHRDVSATACPGDRLHGLLGALRSAAAERAHCQPF